jgi:hypothetical protein
LSAENLEDIYAGSAQVRVINIAVEAKDRFLVLANDLALLELWNYGSVSPVADDS